MIYLVTGVAGFIGFHVARALLDRGETVVGVDDLNPYYAVELKHRRLAEIRDRPNFSFRQVDIADPAAVRAALAGVAITHIVHLAAQAGVRHSLQRPEAYVASNLVGHVTMLELARGLEGLRSMTYASSSSVYGGNTTLPFRESDRVDQPLSLYAATKKADELMSHSYAHLFRLPLTGLRFFTVYGEWGRPDMAMWLWTEAILAGRPITLFNGGDMLRDFTHVDDVVRGVLAVTDAPPADDGGSAPHRLYNIGNHRPEPLAFLIDLLEKATGRQAIRRTAPMQPGDVPATFADIDAITRDHGFCPAIPLEEGVPRFVRWFRNYHRLGD